MTPVLSWTKPHHCQTVCTSDKYSIKGHHSIQLGKLEQLKTNISFCHFPSSDIDVLKYIYSMGSAGKGGCGVSSQFCKPVIGTIYYHNGHMPSKAIKYFASHVNTVSQSLPAFLMTERSTWDLNCTFWRLLWHLINCGTSSVCLCVLPWVLKFTGRPFSFAF